jgi:type IV pilus assembly protein PilE
MTVGRGFTLIELMMTVAVLGMLAAIVLPSYQDSIRKTRRADAKAALNNIAQQLERCRTQFGVYNDDGCVIDSPQASPEGFYSVTIVRNGTTYTLTATPQGAQAKDTRCGALTLNQLGQRGSNGTLPPAQCW